MASDPVLIPRHGANRSRSCSLHESSDALVALTPEGRIQFWNRAAHDMFGTPPRRPSGVRSTISPS